jgi:hypothetical protein
MEDVGIDVHKNQSQIGAARSPSGAALPSVAERARPQPCDALSGVPGVVAGKCTVRWIPRITL